MADTMTDAGLAGFEPTSTTGGIGGTGELDTMTGVGAGGGFTTGTTPVPVSVIRSGLLEAFVVTVVVAFNTPPAVGRNA